ncbi:MAG: lamin tail domain-containing protein [Planctomycetes bacterium]|nr:lamin tail domain-containing protein [Planctomycetota bacterium]
MFRSQRFVVTGTPRLRSSGSMISRSRVSRKLQRISVAFIPGILVFANSADARSLAITEFLNHPGSTELTEWVELFNYSPNALDLSGWTMSDEIGDLSALPDIILPSGGFLILTANKAEFEAEWFGGTANAFVWEFSSGFELTNAADQIIISNALAEVVWNIAWVNDESPGRATFLTATDFVITDFGSLAFPGISRSGDDLGISGFLGYQQNDITSDPWAVSSFTGDVGSPLAGGFAAIPSPGSIWLLGLVMLKRRRRRSGENSSAEVSD